MCRMLWSLRFGSGARKMSKWWRRCLSWVTFKKSYLLMSVLDEDGRYRFTNAMGTRLFFCITYCCSMKCAGCSEVWDFAVEREIEARRGLKYRFSPITSDVVTQDKNWRYGRLQWANAEISSVLNVCVGLLNVAKSRFWCIFRFSWILGEIGKMWVKFIILLLEILASYGSADCLCVFCRVLRFYWCIKL